MRAGVAAAARRPDRGAATLVVVASIATIVLVAFLALPLVGLLTHASPGALAARLADPAVREALRLSLLSSLLATTLVVLVGTPAAYLLATRDFPGKRLVEVLVELPMVLPPTVAGFALLMAFGRMGLAGPALSGLGVSLPFTTAAVVLAQAFMAAPFYVAPARAGFASVDPRLLDAAATLRANETVRFLRVVLPLSMPALAAGAALAAARALGEFGATITFAGNLPGVTQTMPLAVYVALQSNVEAAAVLSLLLLVVSFGLLLALKATGRATLAGGFHARSARPAPAR